MEGINQLTNEKLISLSEQELVDCDVNGVDQGCNGSLMDEAFKLIINNKGLNTEVNYSYAGEDQTCNSKKESQNAATINGYQYVLANSEVSLQKAVAHQPASLAIDASGYNFQLYASGVFTGSYGTDLDHGVTTVRYGVTSDGTKYLLVKISCGVTWDEEGYARMQRDIEAKEGLCDIAMEASYLTS